jgi:rod shape-determining protein MreD
LKAVGVLIAVVIAVVLQVTLARYTVGGRWVFDFVLVGVMFAALQWGPAAGVLSGTVGGLLQDVLSGGIVGVGGLVKTLVGFGAGIVGTQFVLAKPYARMVIVMAATVVHRLLVLSVYGLIDQRWPGVVWTAMLAEIVLNAVSALLVFQTVSVVPEVVARQRMSRRSSLSRRQW